MEANTGTKPVAESHAFDTRALERLPDDLRTCRLRRPAHAVEQFKGGQSNPTYKLQTPGAAYVMRTKPGPADKLLASAHAIEREFTVMRALHRDRRAGAEACTCCARTRSVIGRAFYVMEFMPGRVLWEQSLPVIARADRAAYYDEMNRVIAALHNVDVTTRSGSPPTASPATTSSARSAAGRKQYQASITTTRSRPWTGSSNGCRRTSRRAPATSRRWRSCTATTGSTT